jgi:bisphosphoglycerate-dependent phosphoglycerate mutase
MIIQEVLFNKNECDDIIALSKINAQKWKSMDRKYNSLAIDYSENTKWVFDRLQNFFEKNINKKITELKKQKNG